MKIRFERNWSFENLFGGGIFKKLNFGMFEFLEIKFERNWNFENYLRIGVLKINWELEFWKLSLWKLESWKLFEDGILKIK